MGAIPQAPLPDQMVMSLIAARKLDQVAVHDQRELFAVDLEVDRGGHRSLGRHTPITGYFKDVSRGKAAGKSGSFPAVWSGLDDQKAQ